MYVAVVLTVFEKWGILFYHIFSKKFKREKLQNSRHEHVSHLSEKNYLKDLGLNLINRYPDCLQTFKDKP